MQPRRSTRSHKVPSHLQDYVCSNTHTSWCNLATAPPDYMACFSTIEEFREPISYEQALKHLGMCSQVEAMKKEINSLQVGNTWKLLTLPSTKTQLRLSGFIK